MQLFIGFLVAMLVSITAFAYASFNGYMVKSHPVASEQGYSQADTDYVTNLSQRNH